MSNTSKNAPTKVVFKSQASFKSNPIKFIKPSSSFLHDEGAQHQEFEHIKKKHDKIALLESEISNVQKRLTDFYFKMKEVLEKDPIINRDLKHIFFNESLREHIIQCDSITMIEFIEKIIMGAVNLSHNLAEIPRGTQLIRNDSDYVIILQKLEEEILLLKQRQLEDEFVIEALKSKIDELQDHNNKIIEKSAQTAQSFKQDYYKLLTIIHELEYDISHLKDTIREKEAEIQAVNEKNFSIFVLEHKIKSLDQKYRKDVSKNKAKFNLELKHMKDSRISDPNYYQRMHGIETQIHDLESKLYFSERKSQKIEEVKNCQVTGKNEEKNFLEKKINELNNEVFELKEKIADRNKEIRYLRIENMKRIEPKVNVTMANKTSEDNNNNNLINIKKMGKSFNFNNTTTFNKTWGTK